jgi:hypothetical protein
MTEILNITSDAKTGKIPLYKSGDRYGRLILTGKSYTINRFLYVEYICECGNIRWTTFYKIRDLHTKSCGCLKLKLLKERNTTHGMWKHPLCYSVWHGIKNRCYNQNEPAFKDYGARGIKVCDEWINDFKSFYDWSMLNGWEKGLEIDRINNNGHYEPSNCRYTTRVVNSKNKRTNIYVEAFGENKCLSDWVRDSRCSVTAQTIKSRINSFNWTPERAISVNSLTSKSKIINA